MGGQTALETPLSMIAAIGVDRGIGKDNKLLFRVKEDQEFFRETTKYQVVVMGRKTWESLPKKPLKGRANIVISSSLKDEGVQVLPSFDSLFKFLNSQFPGLSAFVIGGETLYRELLPYTNTVYLTEFQALRPADRFFPELSETEWRAEILRESYSKGLNYKFMKYIRT